MDCKAVCEQQARKSHVALSMSVGPWYSISLHKQGGCFQGNSVTSTDPPAAMATRDVSREACYCSHDEHTLLRPNTSHNVHYILWDAITREHMSTSVNTAEAH